MKYLSVIIFSFLLVSCQQGSPEEQTNTKGSVPIENELTLTADQLNTIEITNVELEEKQISQTLRLNGKVDIDPNYRVSLSSALGGHIKSINALPGKFVKKGEIILSIEDNQFIQIQQDYLIAQAQLLSAEPNYSRQKELNNNKSTSDKIMQEAETAYYSLLAVKNGLEEKLRLININPSYLEAGKIQRSINIIAPFDGFVSKVMVNKGKYVSASDELIEIINPQGLLMNIKVFEKDLPKIKVGQNIDVFTNDSPDNILKTKVISTGSTIYEDGSTAIVAKSADANSIKFVSGQYINALVALENIAAYTLPANAVVSFEGRNYIFEQLDDAVFRLHEVEAGEVFEDTIPINNHQEFLNKKIVDKGAYTLLMALKNKAEE